MEKVGWQIALRDGSGFVKKRTKSCVLRHSRFNPDVGRVECFREMVMFYYSYRNERQDLIENDNERTCIAHRILIAENQRKYDMFEQTDL